MKFSLEGVWKAGWLSIQGAKAAAMQRNPKTRKMTGGEERGKNFQGPRTRRDQG